MAAENENSPITDYQEKYRSQFHFSPATGWIGDPDGCVRCGGKYHLFWWGKATSTDLVHYDQVTIGDCFALADDPGFGDFATGGAVVDVNNTAGFGENKMIAIYTTFSWPQRQAISYSLDDTHDTFGYYKGNPVLEREGVYDFRDPCVFWDAESRRWVMAIALAVDKKIAFYQSANLKDWSWMSDFGPLGAREGMWECPDLVRMTMDDGAQKWVLVVSANPNKEQYFVGEFDGTKFVTDDEVLEYLQNGVGLEGEVFAGFNGGSYDGWTATGDAFGNAPLLGSHQAHLGAGLATSNMCGDDKTGTLTSPEFTIEKNAINFLISGGNRPGVLAINLLINGEVARGTTGDGTGNLKWNGWDVSDLKGQKARIQLLDEATGDWGHIDVDHIMFSDVLHDEKSEHALWVDFGADFYASRTFRDYDGTAEETLWLGWMGNWDYAAAAPAIPVDGYKDQRGALSIARSLHLIMADGLPRLTQQPVEGLIGLRGKETAVSITLPEGAQAFTEFQPSANTYEFEATFTPGMPDSEFGLNLLVGDGRKLKLGYNAATGTLYIDRTNCADVDIPAFGRRMSASLATRSGKIKLQVFVDKKSIEVFANGGERVMTAMTFPDETQVGIELFSNGSGTRMDFSGWMLDSIWPGHIQNKPVNVGENQGRS